MPKDILPLTLNYVVYILDDMCLEDAARLNKTEILVQNSDFITEKNIQSFIDAASAGESSECTAWLLKFREEHFGGFDISADLEL